MGLGLVCHYVVPNAKGVLVNVVGNRTIRHGDIKSDSATRSRIKEVALHNIRSHFPYIGKIADIGASTYRITSVLFPSGDQTYEWLLQDDEVVAALQHFGDLMRKYQLRPSFHPGQHCSLSSDSSDVVARAIVDLAHHAAIFDAMKFPRSHAASINVHGGCAGRIDNLCSSIELLPDAIRSRLTLENDETCYSVADLTVVHSRCDVPIVFDSHHHTFNDGGLSADDAYEVSKLTWPTDVRPLMHVASTEPELVNGSFNERRRHSRMLHSVLESQRVGAIRDEIDLELECKDKNIAFIDARARYFSRI